MQSDDIVVVIEADRDLRELLCTILGDMRGVRAMPAEDGERGLRLIQGAKPALVLLDLALPDPPSGLAVLRRLRDHPATQSLPVMVVAAFVQARQAALEAGCAEFVEEPFEVEEIESCIRRHLPDPRAERAS